MEGVLNLVALDNFLESALMQSTHIDENFLRGIAFFIAYTIDPPNHSVEDISLRRLNFEYAESIIFKFYEKRIKLDMDIRFVSELDVDFFLQRWICDADYLRKIQRRAYFPRTPQLLFVDHLVVYLKELSKDKPDLVGPLKHEISRLQTKLELVSCSIMEIPESLKEDPDLQNLIRSVTNIAYKVEYIIDSFLVGDIPIWKCIPQLGDILREFKGRDLERKLEIFSTGNKIEIEFDTEFIVKSRLLDRGQRELVIFPIVNNADIGDKLGGLFYHSDLVEWFGIRTWSLVSFYKERKKEVFLELLRNVSYAPFLPLKVPSDKLVDMSEEELKESVRKIFEGERYFIILEDLQDIEALYDILRVLPLSQRGGRIVLTTPTLELADKCRRGLPKVDHPSISQTQELTTDDDVVGFKAETQMMLERLIGESKQLRIISIVGMAGQGKTTLANKLYNHFSVVDYFDIRLQCCISQTYEKRDLLLDLLGQGIKVSSTILHKDDEELADMLYKYLKGQRFLVLLDDMWKIEAWNDLLRCFPNDNNGSIIMFTTRIRELALHAKSDSILQSVYPLSDDESWALLKKRTFKNESYSPELLEIGRQIAKSCRGLPLSVVLTAGLLQKMEKNVERWNQIAEKLNSHILRVSDEKARAKAIIELSYKHLPDHSKPLFLYFGAFLEDREILVSKLMRLWIAEGFVRHTDMKSLEDISEDYLTDLIDRSLVTIAKEKSNGGAKSCRIHDLLREFCLIKATEENFLEIIHGYDELFPSSIDTLDPPYFRRVPPYLLRRLCIYSKRSHFIMLKPFGLLVRSLLFFATIDMSPTCSYDISFISQNFKLLTILNLEDINIGNSFKAIDMLIHLRYLVVQSCIDLIPASIANLWKLETFCFKALEDKVVTVPDSIWDMAKLRHVHINDIASFDLDPSRVENYSMLNDIKSFSTPSLVYGDDMEKVMRSLQGMRKLKCIFLDYWDDTRNCNRFPRLEILSQLVSLNVFYKGIGKWPCEFNLPSNIKKLTLSNFHMPWNEFPQLASLGNLEVLKLLCNAFEGEAWEMKDEKFPKLKFLKMDMLNVVKWSASCENFSRLERLILHKCEQLEEIPFDIAEIITLQKIEVVWCNPSTAISARRIQEEQLEFGNQQFKVHVHPKVWDHKLP